MTFQSDSWLTKDDATALSASGAVRATTDESSSLLVVREDPFNAETRLTEHGEIVTPTAAFYVRNHFSVPRIDVSQWRLRLDGEVEAAQMWRYEELVALPSRTLLVTMECAGNGRSGMVPRPQGEPWQYGAVSTAEWTGVSLAYLLRRAGLSGSAIEVVAKGADSGFVAEAHRSVSFSRSLPLVQALHPDTLLAHAMNGEPLTPEHRFPASPDRAWMVRAYTASIKWLVGLTVSAIPSAVSIRPERYIMVRRTSAPARRRLMRVLESHSQRWRFDHLLVSLASGQSCRVASIVLQGLAWSGAAPVTRVEVSTNGRA